MKIEVPDLSVFIYVLPQFVWQTDDSSANMLAGFSVFFYKRNR
jgi:hypothetical protein